MSAITSAGRSRGRCWGKWPQPRETSSGVRSLLPTRGSGAWAWPTPVAWATLGAPPTERGLVRPGGSWVQASTQPVELQSDLEEPWICPASRGPASVLQAGVGAEGCMPSPQAKCPAPFSFSRVLSLSETQSFCLRSPILGTARMNGLGSWNDFQYFSK